ncbi:hypothetical protein [Jiulongibacter sp. NS-SX5]|uniref:hypothetical protein n=1 Tax=Jiulongibacter sp. NS-SX5 TaxID=3463854 RepID=UPI0040585F7D
MRNYVFHYPHYFRYFGLILLALSIGIFLYRLSEFGIFDLTAFSTPAAFSLVFIYFSKEKMNDERVVLLKFKALALAIPIAGLIFALLDYSVNFDGYSIETDSWYSHSAFEYLTLALLLAYGIFQFLKFKE